MCCQNTNGAKTIDIIKSYKTLGTRTYSGTGSKTIIDQGKNEEKDVCMAGGATSLQHTRDMDYGYIYNVGTLDFLTVLFPPLGMHKTMIL